MFISITARCPHCGCPDSYSADVGLNPFLCNSCKKSFLLVFCMDGSLLSSKLDGGIFESNIDELGRLRFIRDSLVSLADKRPDVTDIVRLLDQVRNRISSLEASEKLKKYRYCSTVRCAIKKWNILFICHRLILLATGWSLFAVLIAIMVW